LDAFVVVLPARCTRWPNLWVSITGLLAILDATLIGKFVKIRTFLSNYFLIQIETTIHGYFNSNYS